MGYKQDDKGESSIGAVEAVGRFDVVFEGPVESLDELLVGSELLGLTVKVLESYHFAVL